jgi:hypothetical protein
MCPGVSHSPTPVPLMHRPRWFFDPRRRGHFSTGCPIGTVGERLADRWLGCRGYCQPGLDRSPGILAGEAFVEAGGRLDRQQAAVDRDQGIAAGMSLSAIDVVSSLPELSVRAAPAAMKPTQAPNIDPNRKTVANVTEQPPQQLIAFVGSIARTARTSAHSPTLGGWRKLAAPSLRSRSV